MPAADNAAPASLTLQEYLNTKRGAGATLLVDVRTPAEFREKHAPEAVNMPLDTLGNQLEELRRRAEGKDIVLMCRTQNRAGMACAQIAKAGLQHLSILQGGITAWEESGEELVRGKTKSMSLERQVRIAAGSLVLAGTLVAWYVSPWGLALSGFVGAGLVFAGVTDTCGMAMLLAKMPWNR